MTIFPSINNPHKNFLKLSASVIKLCGILSPFFTVYKKPPRRRGQTGEAKAYFQLMTVFSVTGLEKS